MGMVVLIVLTIAFFIVRLAPGDPAALMLGPDATPEQAEELRSRLGLDPTGFTHVLTGHIQVVLRGIDTVPAT